MASKSTHSICKTSSLSNSSKQQSSSSRVVQPRRSEELAHLEQVLWGLALWQGRRHLGTRVVWLHQSQGLAALLASTRASPPKVLVRSKEEQIRQPRPHSRLLLTHASVPHLWPALALNRRRELSKTLRTGRSSRCYSATKVLLYQEEPST